MVKQPEDDIGFHELEEPVVVGSLGDAIKPNPDPLQGEYISSLLPRFCPLSFALRRL